MGNEIVPCDIVDAELVDDICGCGAPGQLVVDPYSLDVCDEVVHMVLCDDCYQARVDDI